MKKTFIERITPETMTSRLKEITAKRSDVRVLLYMLGPQRMLEWIQAIGVCEDETLRASIPPFPPLELRQITAAPDLSEFLWTGLVDMDRIMSLYEKVTVNEPVENPSILDFGCGCGRMVRFLSDYGPTGSIHACEVNPDHMKWCRDNLTSIQISQSEALPPLPYIDQMFNMIYGLSVFTHLTEENATKWLAELKRVLKPNGILIVTISGYASLNTIKKSVPHQQMTNLKVEEVEHTIENFPTTPFVFFKYNKSAIDIAKAGSEYGITFIHPDYIYKNWASEGFKVLEIIPGGLRGWQDIVILQRNK